MTEQEQEQLEKMFERLYDYEKDWERWEQLKRNGTAVCSSQQVQAVIFLHDKLKHEERPQDYFFHGEHDVLYIGQNLEIFQPFTEDDVLKALAYGIEISADGEGFQIYASM